MTSKVVVITGPTATGKTRLGVALGVTPADVPGRIEAACACLGLPTSIPCTPEEYAAAIGADYYSKDARESAEITRKVLG